MNSAVSSFPTQPHGTRYHRLSVIHLCLLQAPATYLKVNYLSEHMASNYSTIVVVKKAWTQIYIIVLHCIVLYCIYCNCIVLHCNGKFATKSLDRPADHLSRGLNLVKVTVCQMRSGRATPNLWFCAFFLFLLISAEPKVRQWIYPNDNCTIL